MIEKTTREKGRVVTTQRNFQTVNSEYNYGSTIVTPEEYRLLYSVPPAAERSKIAARGGARTKTKRHWRFRPRSFGALVVWGLILFAGFHILVAPLVEGVYNYVARDTEIRRLKTQYAEMGHELIAMRKTRDNMKTMAYVEERSHQIGLIKPHEAKMVVVESSSDGQAFRSTPRKNDDLGY